MPIIEMHMTEGRTPEQKSKVAAAVTEAVCRSLDCPATTVRVLITEHREHEFYIAGMTKTQRDAQAAEQAS